jgi:U3 small nucleolar RNA-associated protein 23
MKVNRAKSIRKFLRFFRLVFGLKAPYFVLLDGNFLFEATKYKIDILDRIKSSLQGDEVRLVVTGSVLAELKKVGAKAKAALDYAEKCCEIIDDSTFLEFGETPGDKMTAMVKSLQQEWVKDPQRQGHRRYFVATQDKKLRKCLSGIAGTPLFYLNNVSFVMEPPSQTSKDFNTNVEGAKTALNEQETEIVQKLTGSGKKRKRDNVVSGVEDKGGSSDTKGTETEQQQVRTKHKAKAANPMSSRPADMHSSRTQKKKKAQYKR